MARFYQPLDDFKVVELPEKTVAILEDCGSWSDLSRSIYRCG